MIVVCNSRIDSFLLQHAGGTIDGKRRRYFGLGLFFDFGGCLVSASLHMLYGRVMGLSGSRRAFFPSRDSAWCRDLAWFLVKPCLMKIFSKLLILVSLVSSCGFSIATDWRYIGKSKFFVDLYLDIDSIRVLEDSNRVAVALFNIINAKGNEESMMFGTIHNCLMHSKRDQFSRKTIKHWGGGDVISTSGEEENWYPVKNGSIGEDIHRAVCDEPIKAP